MAINLKEYKTTKEQNIKVHKKDIRLFLFDFRINSKRYRKNFKVKATNHTPSQMLKTARTQLDVMKDEIMNDTYGNDLITLDNLFIEYMKTQPLTDWTHKKTLHEQGHGRIRDLNTSMTKLYTKLLEDAVIYKKIGYFSNMDLD